MESNEGLPMNQALPLRLPSEFLKPFHEKNGSRHLKRALVFLICYVSAAAAAIYLAKLVRHPLLWVGLIPFYLLAAASLHGLSLFTHEAVHGTLSRIRLLNHLFGSLCAIPVLQNFAAYRVLHLQHHEHLGDQGDPDHYANYTRWTWMVFLMNWSRLLVGYPVYLVAIPFLGLRQGTSRDRLNILLEIFITLLLGWVVLKTLPFSWVLHGWLCPMVLINSMVNIRGMSQHTLLEHSADTIQGTRSIITSPLVRYFMCNENYHLEHHLYPGVPWYHLPMLHSKLEAQLRERGAPYIQSYRSFLREFLIHSLKRSPWGRRRKPSSGA